MKISLFKALVVGLLTIVVAPAIAQSPRPYHWSSTETMVVGATLGAAEGLACSVADTVIPWPISWFLLSEIKALLAKAIVNDAYKNGETLNVSLLHNTSRIASWLSYLALFHPRTFDRTITFYGPIGYATVSHNI